MAELDQGEKTEEPTQQRREDFRKRGQVVQTRELSSFLVLMISLICISTFGSFFFFRISNLFTHFFILSTKEGSWNNALSIVMKESLFILLPLFLIFWLISFFSSFLQIGFLVNEEALQIKWERLDPLAGIRRIFSLRSFVEGGKAFLKFTFVALVVFFVARLEMEKIPYLVYSNIGQTFQYLTHITLKLLGGISVVLIGLSALDYFFQRWDLEQKMKMTKQEVKEELKAREGDPFVKTRIRRIQKEILNRKMMAEVPKSDVVITNPTHIAVALKYTEKMIAPQIVAKGIGFVAEKIKALAKKNNISIVENKPLARIMYKTLKIGQIIPKELYSTVAEILSYVYKLKRKKLGLKG